MSRYLVTYTYNGEVKQTKRFAASGKDAILAVARQHFWTFEPETETSGGYFKNVRRVGWAQVATVKAERILPNCPVQLPD